MTSILNVSVVRKPQIRTEWKKRKKKNQARKRRKESRQAGPKVEVGHTVDVEVARQTGIHAGQGPGKDAVMICKWGFL